MLEHGQVRVVESERTAPSPKRKLHTDGWAEPKPPTVRSDGVAGPPASTAFAAGFVPAAIFAATASFVVAPMGWSKGLPVFRSVARVPDIQPRSPLVGEFLADVNRVAGAVGHVLWN